MKFDGSGGNYIINFSRQNFLYKVYRNVIREKGAPEFLLSIERDGRGILKERGDVHPYDGTY